MSQFVIDIIKEVNRRLAAGSYTSKDLRGLYAALEAIAQAPKYGPELLALAAAHQMEVLALMSAHLRPHALPLDRLPAVPKRGLDRAQVARRSQAHDYGPPVVVRGNPTSGALALVDGKHRLAAARANGENEIRAVFAKYQYQESK